MTVARNANKGKHLNSLEKYHTILITKQGTHVNDFNIDSKQLHIWIDKPKTSKVSQ